MPKLVEIALDMALNSMKDKEQSALMELLVYLNKQGCISSTDILSGLTTFTVQLEELR